MTFTLTGPTIAAFFLGVLTVAGTYLLIRLWRWTLHGNFEIVFVPVMLSVFGAAAWAMLFATAFR